MSSHGCSMPFFYKGGHYFGMCFDQCLAESIAASLSHKDTIWKVSDLQG
jgi:hypothetical protein